MGKVRHSLLSRVLDSHLEQVTRVLSFPYLGLQITNPNKKCKKNAKKIPEKQKQKTKKREKKVKSNLQAEVSQGKILKTKKTFGFHLFASPVFDRLAWLKTSPCDFQNNVASYILDFVLPRNLKQKENLNVNCFAYECLFDKCQISADNLWYCWKALIKTSQPGSILNPICQVVV